mmetsp:Transcript_51528/g.118369  ORF Transcript_51528/g.118369 Transcript_51528/m.118369 type:complete len:340 (-) Transcript_51528:201-1220(-)
MALLRLVAARWMDDHRRLHLLRRLRALPPDAAQSPPVAAEHPQRATTARLHRRSARGGAKQPATAGAIAYVADERGACWRPRRHDDRCAAPPNRHAQDTLNPRPLAFQRPRRRVARHRRGTRARRACGRRFLPRVRDSEAFDAAAGMDRRQGNAAVLFSGRSRGGHLVHRACAVRATEDAAAGTGEFIAQRGGAFGVCARWASCLVQRAGCDARARPTVCACAISPFRGAAPPVEHAASAGQRRGARGARECDECGRWRASRGHCRSLCRRSDDAARCGPHAARARPRARARAEKALCSRHGALDLPDGGRAWLRARHRAAHTLHGAGRGRLPGYLRVV